MLYFERWKIVLIVLISVLGIAFTLPNFFPARSLEGLPDWLPKRQMVLGLDLQGGSHLLLEVDREAVLKDRLEALRDDVRRVLREARIGYSGLGLIENGVQVRLRDPAQAAEARQKLDELTQPVGGLLTGTAPREAEIEDRGDGSLTLRVPPQAIEARVRSAVEQSMEIVRRRIDELGTTEPVIQRQGADRIVVQVPGLQDPARLKSLLGQTAKLTFRMVDLSMSPEQAAQTRPPADSEILNSTDDPPQQYLVERRVLVSGEDLVDAQAGFDPDTREPIVSFRFNTNGARRFAQVTQANVGRPFAIVLDNEVVSAPVIRQPILQGNGQISGNFTVESANDLAVLLRAGALPAPLTILEERTVGPGLGADSVASGATATVIGTVLVICFMIATYGLMGVFAVLAMIINVSFTIAILSALGATLTLPGIAGIVLSVGMAVDANVLIYERMREEQRGGRNAISAIDTGFTKAVGTITDSNLTLLIAAAVLFFLGTGPIRGFAITLAIGNITSFFTAVTVTRLMVAQWVRYARPRAVPV